MRAAVAALRDVPVLFVGLRLPLVVAEARERARGDRGLGGATAFHGLVHAHGVYDLELDTSTTDPEACASTIERRLAAGPEPSAFRVLARRLPG